MGKDMMIVAENLNYRLTVTAGRTLKGPGKVMGLDGKNILVKLLKVVSLYDKVRIWIMPAQIMV